MLLKLIPIIYLFLSLVSANEIDEVNSLSIQKTLLPVFKDSARPEINMAVLWREALLYLNEKRHLQVQILSPKVSGTYPVIVFSGGWGVNFRHYNHILTRLAEKGYIIVNIDHYYQKDTAFHSAEFDETIARFKKELKGQNKKTKEKRFTRTKFRALKIYYQDYLFILQNLKEILHAIPGSDLSKIILMGHSLGGNAGKKLLENLSHLTLSEDIKTAIKACVSLDSRYNQLHLSTRFEKPTLLLGAGEEYKKSDALRKLPLQPNLQVIILENASHVSFMDYVIYPFLEIDTNLLMEGLNSSAMTDTQKLINKVKADPKTFFNGTPDQLNQFIVETVYRIDQFIKKVII